MDSSFSERLRRGDRLYGTLIVSPSPQWPENVKKLGLDFVFIDTEHIALDRQQLAWMCQAYKALGLPPIVRITSPDPFLACAALDGGASGIIAPYVESAEQARDLVGAVKLRPIKGKKLQDLLENRELLDGKLKEYITRGTSRNTLILNIESVEGMKNMDDILSVEGIDGVLIGPHDLSSSMEIPEEYRLPEFDSAVCEIIQRARAKGLGAGIHFCLGDAGLDLELKWIEDGANFIVHSADIIAAMQGLKKEFDILKSGLLSKSKSPEESESINI
jgi:2-keto-3-deoxy-L-rhamnonate aldolase RhmA